MIKKNNKFYILIVLFLFGISIGYAAINKTLNITGNSEVKKATWDIHFENVLVTNGSALAVKLPTIENSNLSVDFSVNLDLPGDFYEFTVDVVNSGTIDAMIDSVVKTPELTLEQAKYLNYIIEYQNGVDIASRQLLQSGKSLRIKVRVEYRTDLTEYDLPSTFQTLDLGFTINYVQSDYEEAREVYNNGILYFYPYTDGNINEIGTVVTIGTEKFYVIGHDGDNVKLLSMYNLYVGEVYTKGSGYTSITNSLGMQSSIAKGYYWDFENNVEVYPYVGVTAFSTYNQMGVNDSDYEGSLAQVYVNNYKDALVKRFNVSIIEARLIRKDELTDSNTFQCVVGGSCSSLYPFIYSTTYWTETPDDRVNSLYNNLIIQTSNSFVGLASSSKSSTGIRPVIVIPKNEIGQLITFTIQGKSYYGNNGMTWDEWVGSSFNPGDFIIVNHRIAGIRPAFVDRLDDIDWAYFSFYNSQLNPEYYDDIILADNDYGDFYYMDS